MPSIDVIPIKGGIKSDISVEYSSQMNYLFTNKYDASLIESHAEYLEDLEAPVQKGDVIGQLTYTYDGKFMDSIDIIASESIKKARRLYKFTMAMFPRKLNLKAGRQNSFSRLYIYFIVILCLISSAVLSFLLRASRFSYILGTIMLLYAGLMILSTLISSSIRCALHPTILAIAKIGV